MLIRRETEPDITAVRAVTQAAFVKEDGAETYEVRILDGLRECDVWIPALSLVAEDGDQVVGHVVCTRAHVDGVPVVALGPISVLPDRQRDGIGKALVHTALGVADGLDEPLMALLGDPAYYSRFGFVCSKELGIDPPEAEWGDYFQVRPLAAYDEAIRGAFVYAAPFREL